jgi:hypothetical protein
VGKNGKYFALLTHPVILFLSICLIPLWEQSPRPEFVVDWGMDPFLLLIFGSSFLGGTIGEHLLTKKKYKAIAIISIIAITLFSFTFKYATKYALSGNQPEIPSTDVTGFPVPMYPDNLDNKEEILKDSPLGAFKTLSYRLPWSIPMDRVWHFYDRKLSALGWKPNPAFKNSEWHAMNSCKARKSLRRSVTDWITVWDEPSKARQFLLHLRICVYEGKKMLSVLCQVSAVPSKNNL